MVVPGHGWQYYRLGSDDLAAPDGLSPPWPLRPGELDPWYALVERRLGLFGARDGLGWLPDSELSQAIQPTPAEAALQRAIAARWPGGRSVMARFAPPFDTLEVAARTGRLLICQGAVVREIETDRSGRVQGVIWLDQRNRTEHFAPAHLVFLCASTLESTRILLLSRSSQSGGGLGAASGVLGRCLMDHVQVSAKGHGPPLLPGSPPQVGRCLYLPRFDARGLPVPPPRERLRRAAVPRTTRQGSFLFCCGFLCRDASAARKPGNTRCPAARRLGHPYSAHRLRFPRHGAYPRAGPSCSAASAC
jgi:hypothetical protein